MPAKKKQQRAVSPSSKATAPIAPASLIAHLQETIAGIVEDFGPIVRRTMLQSDGWFVNGKVFTLERGREDSRRKTLASVRADDDDLGHPEYAAERLAFEYERDHGPAGERAGASHEGDGCWLVRLFHSSSVRRTRPSCRTS